MRFILHMPVLLFLTFFSTQINAQVYEGKQKDIDQILTAIQQFSKYVMTDERDKVAGLYTADAKIFPRDLDILSGEALEAYWQPSPNSKIIYHKITPLEIKVVKNTAYDFGYYEGTTKKDDGTEVSWRGKYVIVWKKVDKEWKIYLDCWNGIKD